MEYLGGNSEGEWTSLSGMYTAEEADFMAQLLGNCSFPKQADQSTTLWHAQQDSFNSQRVLEGSYYSSDNANSNLFSVTTYSAAAPTTSVLFPISSDENYYMSDTINNSSMSMEFCVGDAKNASSYLVEGQDCSLSQDLGKREEADRDVVEPATEEKCNILSENSRKRSRSSADLSVQKSKRNVKARKNQKAVLTGNNDEDGNGGLNVQSSSSCSDEDSNGSQETSTGGVGSSLSSKGVTALNSNGKIRASRGSATDPQSLYARKRRERINERLKVLQKLVPNGTKVDISTMLEEAVEYVKFLQLQIKLLSSDDMWMYAPIAYNGMDLGLNFRAPASRGPE